MPKNKKHTLLLCQEQKKVFGKELNHLKQNKRFSDLSELHSLDIFTDDKGLRLRGWLQPSDLSFGIAY